jgi:hypothetical protein
MTIIKNHFEVFLVTSKKHGNGKSWVIFNKDQFTHICQLNVSCGQDSMSGILPINILVPIAILLKVNKLAEACSSSLNSAINKSAYKR